MEEKINKNLITQEEFIALFPNTRFRYIHDVNGSTFQGNDVLDMSLNEKGYGVFFTVNGFPSTGKADQSQLLSLNGNYVDFDVDAKLPQEEKEKLIQGAIMSGIEAGIPTPTIINRTQKGAHLIWLYTEILKPTPENIAKWKDVQKRLVHCFSGDTAATDPSRVLRMPYSLHLKDPNNPFEIRVMSYKPEMKCILEELDVIVPKYSENNLNDKKWLLGKNGVAEGSRNDTATSMAGKILSSMDPELWEILGWDQLQIWNTKNPKPLTIRELRGIWESIKRRHIEDKKRVWKNISEEKNKKGKAIVKCFADIQSVPISWLWRGRIALGKLTMIAGDPGLGKSLVTATLAAHVSKGYAWPVDQSVPPVGDIILISAEDDPADTIKPRLEAAGADCARVHVVEAIQEETVDTESGSTQRMFSFKRDIATLGDLLSSLPNCRLVIIDPISAYLDSTDSNNNSDIRGLLAPLSELASNHKAAIVLVSHLNKNSGGNASYRVMGSLAFTAAVRTAYIVTKDKENLERRLLMPLKNNIAKDKTGLAYAIVEAENGQPVIAWESEPVEITTEEALEFSQSTEQHTTNDEAVNFLIDLLANGPVKADVAIKEAQKIGIGSKPLRNARIKLGIKPKKSSSFEDGYWVWKLPEDALNTEDAQSKEVGALEQARHLGNTPKTRLDSFVDYLKVEKDDDGIDLLPGDIPF
ncbi:MAG: AAA family ATPase [Patescibacteria group bacterium]